MKFKKKEDGVTNDIFGKKYCSAFPESSEIGGAALTFNEKFEFPVCFHFDISTKKVLNSHQKEKVVETQAAGCVLSWTRLN